MNFFKSLIYLVLLSFLFTGCNQHENKDDLSAITAEELASLFKFDLDKDVYDNIHILNSFDKDKKYIINGKNIIVSKLIPEEIDAENGTLSLFVSGTFNRLSFEETLLFKGFKIVVSDDKSDADNIGDSGKNEETPDEDKENAEISLEDLQSLFVFDINDTVTKVLSELDFFKGEKQVNDKLVFIFNIEVAEQNPEEGSFAIIVTGNVNYKKGFEERLEFSGFKKNESESIIKPSDYNMAQRASVSILPDKNIYTLDFYSFYRKNDTENFKSKLLGVLEITSSNTDGVPYYYTEDDLVNTSIMDLKYDSTEKKLRFKIKYMSYISPELYVYYDYNEYYKSLIQLNNNEISKYYKSGVLNSINESGSIGNLVSSFISVDKNFRVEYKSSNEYGSYINYMIGLLDSDNTELSVFYVAVSGFRDLRNLSRELIITGGEFSDIIRSKWKGTGNLGELIKYYFNNNLDKLSYSMNGYSLNYDKESRTLYSEMNAILYFKDVVIEYESIIRDEHGGITLKVKLSSVNGEITDIVIPVTRFLLSSDINLQ